MLFSKNKYIFNEETLSYELALVSTKEKLIRAGIIILAGFACYFFYSFLFFYLFGMKSPKLAILESRNAELISRVGRINQRLQEDYDILESLQGRDNTVYRPIFGMDEISSAYRNSALGTPEEGYDVEGLRHSKMISGTAYTLDLVSKKASVQSHSFDEVSLLAKRTGEMAFSVPSISPVDLSHSMRVTSPFGYRMHPIRGRVIFHEGIDFSGPMGEPVYSASNGTVESVQRAFFGYGNMVVIDHGFGYKTKYAHLKTILVAEGQHINRGDQLGTLGNSGLSTGPHLHYEVLLRNKHVNPWMYLNNDMTGEEYRTLVHPAGI